MQKRKSEILKEKEEVLRKIIADCKESLKIFKKARQTNIGGKGWCGKYIRKNKTILTACKHELNRLKEMDNILIPKKIFFDNYCGMHTKCTRCSCGKLIPNFENYCSECGKRILWKRSLMKGKN